MQAAAELFKRFRCCDHVWELVPVDDCSVDLTVGSYLVERVSSTGSTVSTS